MILDIIAKVAQNPLEPSVQELKKYKPTDM